MNWKCMRSWKFFAQRSCRCNLGKLKKNGKPRLDVMTKVWDKPGGKHVLHKFNWPLTYYRQIIQRALNLWSKPTGGLVHFKDVTPSDHTRERTADLDILFAKYEHGDKEAFDGTGGIIAHSGYPTEGIVHLDGSEFWSVDGRKGLDIRYVCSSVWWKLTAQLGLNLI